MIHVLCILIGCKRQLLLIKIYARISNIFEKVHHLSKLQASSKGIKQMLFLLFLNFLRVLISLAGVTEMQVSLFSFIPQPITEYSIVYESILNFVKIANRIIQEKLTLFCNGRAFRIVLDTYLQKKHEFYNIIYFNAWSFSHS